MKNLDYWLKKLDLTQKELATRIKVNENTIISWKKKGGEIPEKYIEQLEKMLKEKEEQNKPKEKPTAEENIASLVELIREQNKMIRDQMERKDQYINFLAEKIDSLIDRQETRQRVESNFIVLFERLQDYLQQFEENAISEETKKPE